MAVRITNKKTGKSILVTKKTDTPKTPKVYPGSWKRTMAGITKKYV